MAEFFDDGINIYIGSLFAPVIGEFVIQFLNGFGYEGEFLFYLVNIFFEMLTEFILSVDLCYNFYFVFGVQIVIYYKLFGFLCLDDLSLFELFNYFDKVVHEIVILLL